MQAMPPPESTGGSGGFTSRAIRENMMDAPESSRRLRPSAATSPVGGGDATARGKSRASAALLPRAQRQSRVSSVKARTSAAPPPRVSAAQLLRASTAAPPPRSRVSAAQQHTRDSNAVPKPGALPVPQPDGWQSDRQVVEDHRGSPTSGSGGLGALAEEGEEEPDTATPEGGEVTVAAAEAKAAADMLRNMRGAQPKPAAAEVQTIQTI